MANLPPKPEGGVFDSRPPARGDRYHPPLRHHSNWRADDRDPRDRERQNYSPRSPPGPPRMRQRDSYVPSHDGRDDGRYHDEPRRPPPHESRVREEGESWEPRHRSHNNDYYNSRRGGGRGRNYNNWQHRDSRFDNRRDRSRSPSPRREYRGNASRYDQRRSRSPNRSLSPRRPQGPRRSRSRSAPRRHSPQRRRFNSYPASVASRSPAHTTRGESRHRDREAGGKPRHYSRSRSRGAPSERSHKDELRMMTSDKEHSSKPQDPIPTPPRVHSSMDILPKTEDEPKVKLETEDDSTAPDGENPSPDETFPQQEKGKLKEEQTDHSSAIPKPSSSPPISHPRPVYATRGRSPPKGPRNYVKTPTTPVTPASSSQPNHPLKFESDHHPPARPHTPTLRLPFIPPHPSRPSITAECDAEIARSEARRAILAAEYAQLSKVIRRADHELEMTTIDLQAAEGRRKLAASHAEKAKAGVLGIDYVPSVAV